MVAPPYTVYVIVIRSPALITLMDVEGGGGGVDCEAIITPPISNCSD